MQNDLISRQALIDKFKQLQGADTLANMFVSDVIKVIKVAPGACEELDAYQAIGTLDQCREAVERMKPKGFIQTEKFNTTMWQCPICYSELYSGQNYCDECGNFIGWDGLE